MWITLMAVSFVVGLVVASLLWNLYTPAGKGLAADSHNEAGDAYPVTRCESLISDKQHSLMKMLQRELGQDLYVFPRVRVADVLDVPKNASRRHFYVNLLRSKPVDFILCDAQNTRPVLAIIQAGENEQGEDMDVVRDILRTAEMPTLVLDQDKAYGPSQIKMLVRSAIRHRGQEAAAAAG